MYQLPLNPQQQQMLLGSMNNPQQQQQLMNYFGLMNQTSPVGYFNAMESQLPSYLQFGPSTGTAAGESAKQQFLQSAKPSIAKSRSNELRRGGSGNSFATQQTAQLKSAMNKDASAVYDNARNAEIQRLIAMRQSFMGTPQSNFSNFAPAPVSQMREATSAGTPYYGPSGGTAEKVMSYGKGLDNFLGGAISNLASTLGSNVGQGLTNAVQSSVNPFNVLFKQGGVTPSAGFTPLGAPGGGMSFGPSAPMYKAGL